MRLKCIGGPNDGEYHESRDKRYGDLVNIPQFEPMSICCDVNAVPEITKVNYAYYRIEKLGWQLDSNIKEWNFLLYEKLTIPEIFNKLFT